MSQLFSVVGLMSGTSLDGVDLCYIHFKYSKTDPKFSYQIQAYHTYPYSDYWLNRLKGAADKNGSDLLLLDLDFSRFLGQLCKTFISDFSLPKPDLIASHGHTLFHEPEKGFGFQMGNHPIIAKESGCTVICDFRKQDMAFGGQGAPLVPIGDRLLFSDFSYCLNLGGFANVSFEHEQKRIAYDICPANILLNPIAQRAGKAYDAHGKMAATGNLIPELVDQLNQLDYYQTKPPKSLGLEWVQKYVFPLLRNDWRNEDILASFCSHIAYQIGNNLNQEGKVLITGGGAYNDFLIQEIKSQLKGEAIIPEQELIEMKEALIFALLGLLRKLRINNVLSSVTGAEKDHCSGVIYHCS